MPALKGLPHSEEAERAVLASILLSPQVLTTVAGRLDVRDFYVERHRLLYRAMLDLEAARVEVDLRSLQAHLEQAGTFEAVGGLAYLAALDLDLPEFGAVARYVEIVKERSTRRRLLVELATISRDCYDGRGVDASEALARTEAAVLRLGTEAQPRTLMAFDEVAEETIVRMEERCDGELLGVPSGFPEWDRLSEGLVAGSLIVVAGRPGMGKTSLALDVARHVALRRFQPVALFSLEMSRWELLQRVLSVESSLPFAELRAGRLSAEEWAKLYKAVRNAVGAPLYIDDSPSPSILEIAAKCRALKAARGLSLVVVDYLQLLEGPVRKRNRYENRQQEVTALSRAFKVLAKDLEVPVVLLSQLSRKPEERSRGHRPMLADLRESGAIEQDADMVCFVYREEMYSKDDPDVRGLAELIVEKNRNGPTGTVDLVFLEDRATFRGRNPP